MSTRAMYTFKDERDTIHVYMHSDGYPEGGLSWIANARKLAWPFPRFEASDFAAAFVGANKQNYGNVRLCGPAYQKASDFSGDSEYWYQISFRKDNLHIEIYTVQWWDEPHTETRIFSGTLDKAIKKFKPKWLDDVEKAA